MGKIIQQLGLIWGIVLLTGLPAHGRDAEPSPAPVRVDFFYELNCDDCDRIEAELLPELERRFPGGCDVQRHDIGIDTNFIALLDLEEELGYTSRKRAYLIVNRQHLFGPRPDPETFFAVVARAAEQGRSPNPVPPPDPAPGTASAPVAECYERFTLPMVCAAGLLDGINPCAISTLVFFMSLLAVSKVRNRQLLWLGVSFCLASFLTYLALGFGLLRALHLLSGFETVQALVKWGMAAILLVLAVLSARDALRFRKSHDSHDVTLQLSKGMKKRIHRVLRKGLGLSGIFFGGLFIGMAVTALESVCTGQVYVPTLVLILKENSGVEFRAWMLLVLYNLLFILPLIITFIAVYFGLRTETLLQWSRRNVVFSKTLLTLLFVGMAVLIIRL